MSFLDEFRAAMVAVASKVVSHNDIRKRAYYPNEQQRRVLQIANVEPKPEENETLHDFRVAGTGEILATTYYPSTRAGSGRKPEMRTGRGLPNWLREGETLWMGTDGKSVFVLKSSLPIVNDAVEEAIDEATEQLGRFLDPRKVMERAKASPGPPGRRQTLSTVFERNAWVREFARQRSGGTCEMPGCNYVGFIKGNGQRYIEVHHIQSMARAGFDVIDNVAAICPNCHAMAHHAEGRAAIEMQLIAAIRSANDRYLRDL